jgi:hypothetical protein
MDWYLPYIRNHQIPFQTDANGNPMAQIVKLSTVTTLTITTVALCYIYSRKKRVKMKKK